MIRSFRLIWARHERGLGDEIVLDEDALELEGTDPVVTILEDVVKPGAPPTARRTERRAVLGTFRAHAASAMMCFTLPRAMRSSMSFSVSCVVSGMTTAPIFIAASIVSQSGCTFPSMTRTRSPGTAPWSVR